MLAVQEGKKHSFYIAPSPVTFFEIRFPFVVRPRPNKGDMGHEHALGIRAVWQLESTGDGGWHEYFGGAGGLASGLLAGGRLAGSTY